MSMMDCGIPLHRKLGNLVLEAAASAGSTDAAAQNGIAEVGNTTRLLLSTLMQLLSCFINLRLANQPGAIHSLTLHYVLLRIQWTSAMVSASF